MVLNAGGKGPSDASGPPGIGELSGTLKASGIGGRAALELAGWGARLGGRRTATVGGVEVEDLDRTVAVGRVWVPGGVATLGGVAPGLRG